MNSNSLFLIGIIVSAGCHINDVMNVWKTTKQKPCVSAGCHINDVMNSISSDVPGSTVSAGCHINDVMNPRSSKDMT